MKRLIIIFLLVLGITTNANAYSDDEPQIVKAGSIELDKPKANIGTFEPIGKPQQGGEILSTEELFGENDFTIGFPLSDKIKWGSSPQKLNIDQKDLKCEQTESNKTDCYFYLKLDGRFSQLVFTNNRLLAISIYSKPTDFTNELAYYKKSIGIEPTGSINKDGSEIYYWGAGLFPTYKLDCNKSKEGCFFHVRPTPSIQIAIKQPAKEIIKLLDLTLGYSTSKDFIKIATDNKWDWNKIEGYDDYIVFSRVGMKGAIGIDDVIKAEFEFVDDKLEEVTYTFGSKKVETDYFTMLTKKYGKHDKVKTDDFNMMTKKYGGKNAGDCVFWTINKDTRDETDIGLEYGKTHDIIKTIWYSHSGLISRKSEKDMLKYDAEKQKKEKLLQKSF
jgi:hypothetical protein